MTTTKTIATAVLAGVLSTQYAGGLWAEELSTVQIMKPLHGISFDVGAKRAVSYFLSENGKCKLVLTIAETPNWDRDSGFTVTRFEADVAGGNATRFNPSEGRSLEFACQIHAQSMSVTPIDRVGLSTRP
jgi:hypothetical protein